MKLTTTRDRISLETVYQFVVTDADFLSILLSRFERALIEELAVEKATIADTLLALELIARRIQDTAREAAQTVPTCGQRCGQPVDNHP